MRRAPHTRQPAIWQTHDANGSLTNDGARKLVWDAFNRLVEVRDAATNALVVTYKYDSGNRRVRKTFPAGSAFADMDCLYDGWRTMEEVSPASGATTRQYVWGNYLDEILVMDIYPAGAGYDAARTLGAAVAGDNATNGSGLQNATRNFHHANSLFCVSGVTDMSGNLIEAYQYDPYGRHVRITDGPDADGAVNFSGDDLRVAFSWTASGGSTGAPVHGSPFLFTGQRFDPESGLYYYKNRYYETERGRFVSIDPIGYVDGANLYAGHFVMYGGVDPKGTDVYVATRPMNILWGFAKMVRLHKIGLVHVYLYFDDENMCDKWSDALAKRRIEESSVPLTFSYHPRSVDPTTGHFEGHMVGTLVTVGDYVEMNGDNDKEIEEVGGQLHHVTSDEDLQVAIFERTKTFRHLGDYGFGYRNCGTWAKRVVEGGEGSLFHRPLRGKWPESVKHINFGVGVDGWMDKTLIPQTLSIALWYPGAVFYASKHVVVRTGQATISGAAAFGRQLCRVGGKAIDCMGEDDILGDEFWTGG